MSAAQASRSAQSTKLNRVLGGIVGLVVLAAAIGIALLWPAAESLPTKDTDRAAGETIVAAQVLSVRDAPCHPSADAAAMPGSREGEGAQPPAGPENAGECLEIRAALKVGKPITFTLDEVGAETQSIHKGDRVKLIEYTLGSGDEAEKMYAFYDHPRGGKMLAVAIAFVLIVVAVGRWRGGLALVGVGASVILLTTFVLPAILAGKPPILVAVTGAIGIMVIVLYLAHGVSHRTTAALFGSIFGILFTAIAGAGVTRWLRFTGIGSVEDASLMMVAPGLRMSDVLTATIVIAGLGILNDITVAQASAVWEMRELNPSISKRLIYQSAMRVGRDHIASSIYTLVFAYSGAMFVVLLLLYAQPRDLLELMTSEQIAQEVIRTLIGAAGLVLSMPVTTAFAVWFARGPENTPLARAATIVSEREPETEPEEPVSRHGNV